MLLLILLSCALGHDGPASPGSASARYAEQTAEIEALAAEIEAGAIELEEAATAARSLPDPLARAAAAADIDARMRAIEAADARLQERLLALEAETRAAAGAAAPSLPADAPPAH